MTALATILEFHFPGVGGIRTRQNEDTGKMEIFDWPEALGDEPTQADIGKWTGEFNANPPRRKELDAAVIWRALRSKGVVADTDLPGDVKTPT